ncbi:MAG: TolC family protein [Bacteroidetes bacterium]|nr:TolC family protein [Bacteroidota bacterium]
MQKKLLTLTIFILARGFIFPQLNNQTGSPLQQGTLKNCINYALIHQPSIQQSSIDEEIASAKIRTKLSDWFPQLNFNFSLQHAYELPTSIFQGNAIKFGLINTSSGQFSLTQTLFSRDVLLAASTAHDVREQSKQLTVIDKINIVVNVSKAYYGVLLAQDQIDLINEDVARLRQSKKDTYNQYKSGVVDKTDYMRATVALNNAEAEQKLDVENLKTSFAYLKELMGYPLEDKLKLDFDRSQMENDIFVDTTQIINIQNRLEFQLLETQKRLQHANLSYYEWSFIPTLSAFGEYNLNFMNNNLPKLYNQGYPNSYIGLQLSLPIFQGGKRIQEIDQAKLELKRMDYDIASLANSINTEYIQALSNYKSSLDNYYAQKDNQQLAKEVYNTIQLQYKSGIRTYLDVITAETDLRTTEVNYINALYRVLSSKIDVQKALGEIKF